MIGASDSMGFIRRNLLVCTWLWLLGQAASVSALVPRACCDMHPVAGAATGCHETTPGAECPMRDADGQPCPMHRSSAAVMGHDHHQQADATDVVQPFRPHRAQAGTDQTAVAAGGARPSDVTGQREATDARCRMRGSCNGPASALAALFWMPGVLSATPAVAIGPGVPTTPQVTERLVSALAVFDTPPPRS